MGECETLVRLAYADCLVAGRDYEAARQVLLRAREWLHGRALALGTRGDRHAFCANVPHNEETLRLADEILGPARSAVNDAAAKRGAQ
jgi:hypothetical protein